MKILFVCKHNRFRSKVAEAYFKRINKNKNIQSASAGIFIGNPVAKQVIEIGKKYGLKIDSISRGLREDYLNEFDLFIIVANNVPKFLFNRAEKVIVWKIEDTSQNDKKGIEKIMNQIFKKVDKLNRELKKK